MEGDINIILSGIQVAVLSLQLLVLYLLFKISRRKDIASQTTHIVKSVFDDDSKLTFYDEKIAELMIRIEALEEKIKDKSIIKVLPTHQEKVREVGRELTKVGDLTHQILELLSKGPMTSIEVQKVVGRSREHVARVLKSLYEQGLIDRDVSGKPFRYTITERGREVLSAHS